MVIVVFPSEIEEKKDENWSMVYSSNERVSIENFCHCSVPKLGQHSRYDYYEGRVNVFSHKEREVIASFVEKNNKIQKEDITQHFESYDFIKNPEKFFERALEKGVFHQQRDGIYTVSVPSMKTWLIHHYSVSKKQWKIKETTCQSGKDVIKKR